MPSVPPLDEPCAASSTAASVPGPGSPHSRSICRRVQPPKPHARVPAPTRARARLICVTPCRLSFLVGLGARATARAPDGPADAGPLRRKGEGPSDSRGAQARRARGDQPAARLRGAHSGPAAGGVAGACLTRAPFARARAQTAAADVPGGGLERAVSLEEVKPYWCATRCPRCLELTPTGASRKSLSLEERAAALRVPLAALREYAAAADAAAGACGDGATPLAEALDAALFRKCVSACRSWREWHCWTPTAELRAGCVRAAVARRAAQAGDGAAGENPSTGCKVPAAAVPASA